MRRAPRSFTLKSIEMGTDRGHPPDSCAFSRSLADRGVVEGSTEYYILCDGSATMLIIRYPTKLPNGGSLATILIKTDPVRARTPVRALETRSPCALGCGEITRSVLPDVHHFGLVRHDGHISPDGIDSREDELVRVVSEES